MKEHPHSRQLLHSIFLEQQPEPESDKCVSNSFPMVHLSALTALKFKFLPLEKQTCLHSTYHELHHLQPLKGWFLVAAAMKIGQRGGELHFEKDLQEDISASS